MAKWKVVLTDREFENIDQEIAIMESIDAELHACQIKDEEGIIRVASDCDAIIMQYSHLTKRVIESMPNCKIISKYAIGVDLIDIAAATEHGICVANVPSYCVDEVSTHAVSLILALNRKILLMDKNVRGGTWGYTNAKKIHNLRGQTLGLVSFGKIAQLVAEKMKPFGINILAYDPFVPPQVAKDAGVTLVEFDTLCRESDILSSHVADLPETRGMFNMDVFRRMKNTAYFLNLGRGPVVNEPDLIRALQDGEIAGAGMDVTCPEPIQAGNPLLEMDNVIITPHAAYYSEDSLRRLQRLAAESVAQRLTGYYPKFLVNKELKQSLGLKEWPDGKEGASV